MFCADNYMATAGVIGCLHDGLLRLRTIVKAQHDLVSWYETENDRDNTEDVSAGLRELELALEAAEAAGGG